MKELSGDAKPDMSLIGQFGVGFYSAFMVADRVEVLSRKAGEGEGWRWVSDGQGSFTIEPAANVPRGARITLHMREGDEGFLEPQRLRQPVITRHQRDDETECQCLGRQQNKIQSPQRARDGSTAEQVIKRQSRAWRPLATD